MTNEAKVEYQQTNRQYLRVIVGLSFVVAMVIFGIWLIPKGLALYHQILGNSILEQAVIAGSAETEGGYSVAMENLWDPSLSIATHPEAQSLAREAVFHLNKAITYDPDLSHAYLLLGRALLLLSDYETAVQNYRHYTDLRPNNPLGYWELAQALEGYCRLESAKKIDKNPVETDLRTAPCSNQTMKENIRLAINESGITAGDFLKVSREAHKANSYQDMQRWYEWALLVAGDELDTVPESLVNQIQMLEWFDITDAWKLCPWCDNNSNANFGTNKGVLEMAYRNTIGTRDCFAIILMPDRPIFGFSNLLLRIKANPGTMLTMETVVDGDRSRHINYQPVPERWVVLAIPIKGGILNEVLISIAEKEPISTLEEYHLFIDWIALQ